jgi:hypothetical protein
LFVGHSMKDLLLIFLIGSCAGFNKEQNFVDIVVAVKHYFRSGCVYILHEEEHGECKCRNKSFGYGASDLIHKICILHRILKMNWLKSSWLRIGYPLGQTIFLYAPQFLPLLSFV